VRKVRVDKGKCICRNASGERGMNPKPHLQSNFQNSQSWKSTTIKSISTTTSVLTMADDGFHQPADDDFHQSANDDVHQFESSSSKQSGIYNP
jgi:hypothetical protein